MHQSLLNRNHWIFDMDGTLTIAQHDFDAIRDELGLPEGLPILESLEKLPIDVALTLSKQLDEIELEIAHQSKPAEGAADLLAFLKRRGASLGIVTRNNSKNINVTLTAAGLVDYFLPVNYISRDCAPPKPSPIGIETLLQQWDANPENAVMVGDFHFDLQAGENAGTATVYIDATGEFPFGEMADVCITKLSDLIEEDHGREAR